MYYQDLKKATRYGQLPKIYQQRGRRMGCIILTLVASSILGGLSLLAFQTDQDYQDNKAFDSPTFTNSVKPFTIIMFGIITTVIGFIFSRSQSLLYKQVRNDRMFIRDTLSVLARTLKARDATPLEKGEDPEHKLHELGFAPANWTSSDSLLAKHDIISILQHGGRILPSYTVYLRKYGYDDGNDYKPEIEPMVSLCTADALICSPNQYLKFAIKFQELQTSFLPKKDWVDCSWAIYQLMPTDIRVVGNREAFEDARRTPLTQNHYLIRSYDLSNIMLILKDEYIGGFRRWTMPLDINAFRSSFEKHVIINAYTVGRKVNVKDVVEDLIVHARMDRMNYNIMRFKNTRVADSLHFFHVEWLEASQAEFTEALASHGIKKTKVILNKINIIVQIILDACIVLVPYSLFFLSLLTQSYCGAFASQVGTNGNGTSAVWQQSSPKGVFASSSPFCSLQLSTVTNDTVSQITAVECGSSDLIGKFVLLGACNTYRSKGYLCAAFLLTTAAIIRYFSTQYYTKFDEVKRLTLRQTSFLSRMVNRFRGLVFHTLSTLLFINTLTLFKPKQIAANFYVNRFGLQPESVFELWSILCFFSLAAALVKKLNHHGHRARPRTRLELHIQDISRAKVDAALRLTAFSLALLSLIAAIIKAPPLEVLRAFLGLPTEHFLEKLHTLMTVETLPTLVVYSLAVIQLAVIILITYCCVCHRKSRLAGEKKLAAALELPELQPRDPGTVNPLVMGVRL